MGHGAYGHIRSCSDHNGSYVLASTLSVFAQHLAGGTGIPLFVLGRIWTPVSKEVLNFSSGQAKS